MEQDIAVGLDIGTTKVCAIVASPDDNYPGKLKILGIGKSASEGLTRVQLLMDRLQKLLICFWRTEIAGAMVGQRNGIGARIDLGLGKRHRHLHQSAQDTLHSLGVGEGGNEKFFHAKQIVAECPRPENLADHGNLVAIFLF